MSVWQRSMVRLARSTRLTRVMTRLAYATPLARRFVGGDSPEEGVATARRLRDEHGIAASLFYLGEYVDDADAIATNVDRTLAAIAALGEAGLDANVSVDPTAIGHMVDAELCARNAERLARAVAAHAATARDYLMLDMEDLSLVEPTLRLHERLVTLDLPVAVTLQARLRRSERDLDALVGRRTAIRLVKGAFPLGAEHDHQGRAAIANSYLALAARMLSPEARETGLCPVFATHDHVLSERVLALAAARGWQPHEVEFELLYGVRSEWQRELRNRGVSVRVYLPFGEDWWPYAVRRVGENPRNLLLLGRSLAGRNA